MLRIVDIRRFGRKAVQFDDLKISDSERVHRGRTHVVAPEIETLESEAQLLYHLVQGGGEQFSPIEEERSAAMCAEFT